MSQTLSSLIRPEQGPVLPTFERLAPPPPLNVVAAEIEARSRPGDVVVDLFGRGGWVARTAVAQLRRSYTFESAPLTRLLAEIVLRPPDVRHFDAAVQALAAHPRGDTSLRQSIALQFTSRCPTCGRSVVVDEFIWDGDADGPFRKSYRCATCRDQVGGGEQRTAATEEADVARARDAPGADANLDRLLSRYAVVPGLEGLPGQLLALYTPRTLGALGALVDRLDNDLRAAPVEAALRLALLHAVLPASKLNSYPGRVAALRISNGRVRPTGGRQWRERNPWLLFEDGCRLVRGFIQRVQALPGGQLQARLGDDVLDLADATANVVLRRGLPEPHGDLRGRPERLERQDPRIRLVLTQPPVRWTTESLSFAYHATALVLGPDAAATLPLEGLVGPAPRLGWGWEAAALERGLGAVRPILAPDARAVVMLEPGGPEALVAGALGGVGAGYRLSTALLAEADELVGGTLEFTTGSGAGIRSRAGLPLREEAAAEPPGAEPEHVGAFQLSAVERDVTETAVAILQARGEPARFERLLGEILVGLDQAGHLRRLVGTRTYGESVARAERTAAALGLLGERPAAAPEEEVALARETTPVRPSAPADSPAVARGGDHVAMLLELIQGELSRPNHARLAEIEPGRWWLRDPRDVQAAAIPLSDRLEWAVFSLLATTGGLAEGAFYDRIAAMFRGYDAPDQSLVRACLDSYRSRASTPEMLMTGDDLQARYREHTELVGMLVEYGHRLGLRCWVSPREQKRPYGGRPLGALLTEVEERAYLPLVSRGPVEALEAVDCMWYQRGKGSLIFEVEWTAMLGEAVLRRGRLIPQDDTLVRFLVVLPERVDLVRFKLARSPILRAALDEGNWHILKANHLRTLVAREGADLARFEPYLGLDPEIERQGEQLPLFG
ncbi:MAG TPA: hypothetical protein VN800_00520 [Candidatus Acidoferrales bacterium]|nr:hypothetical protein [Candidatus Acidoferrales bacterium]